jgi:hypothetical protein
MPEGGSVDQIVVQQRGHVDELDRDACLHGRHLADRSGQEDEQRAETLAAAERVGPGARRQPGISFDSDLEPRFHLVEVGVEPLRGPRRRQRRHRASPVCSATIPAAKVR